MSMKKLSNIELVAVRDEEDVWIDHSIERPPGVPAWCSAPRDASSSVTHFEVAQEIYLRVLDGRMNLDDNGDLMEQV